MPAAAPIAILAPFQQQLVGTWKNQDFGKDKDGKPVGGPENPLSYNIMPLPEESDPDGYILKNFKYHETLNFDGTTALTPPARAANRGGKVNQDARALFYEQQVKFAEGPQGPPEGGTPLNDGDVIHVENGLWLWLPRYFQQPGPYPSNPPAPGTVNPPGDQFTNPPEHRVSNSVQQPSDILIAKQISIPHGNSILALGSFDTIPFPNGDAGPWLGDPMIPGSPVIPDGAPPYPMATASALSPDGTAIPPAPVSNLNADARYGNLLTSSVVTPNDFQNPHPEFTLAPNKPLQQAVAIIKPDSYMHWRVTTQALTNGQGVVTNIPFEQRVANVTQYSAEYWMLFKGKIKYLTYTQTILMVLIVKGQKYVFPHLTCNTITFCD